MRLFWGEHTAQLYEEELHIDLIVEWPLQDLRSNTVNWLPFGERVAAFQQHHLQISNETAYFDKFYTSLVYLKSDPAAGHRNPVHCEVGTSLREPLYCLRYQAFKDI